jgi:hypothetical protein
MFMRRNLKFKELIFSCFESVQRDSFYCSHFEIYVDPSTSAAIGSVVIVIKSASHLLMLGGGQ